MCGITAVFGVATQPRGQLAELVAVMTSAVSHRGPDGDGTWLDPTSPIALGHRRLAVLDLSPGGAQPMVGGPLALTYNGEIYNFQELRRELSGKGRVFSTSSDTEVVLRAIEQWGVEGAVQRFNGMFAFAVWDARDQSLTLARDRLGIKPLYVGRTPLGLLVCSDLASVQNLPGWQPTIDRNSLALYFQYGCTPSEAAIYEGFSKMPSGTTWRFTSPTARSAPQPFWRLEQTLTEAKRDGRVDDNELLGTLRHAVRQRLVSDVALGAFLSGGIDSSLVVSLMVEASKTPVRTFSIGSRDPQYDESTHARQVAEHLGTDHTELIVDEADALSTLTDLPRVYSEPFADASMLPTLLVSRLARRHVTVVLSGDGGDELFGGYNRHVWSLPLDRVLRHTPTHLRTQMAQLVQRIPPGALDAAYETVERFAPRRLQMTTFGDKVHKLAGLLSSPDGDEMYARLVSQWRSGTLPVRGPGPFETLRPSPPELALPEVMMFRDTLGYLAHDILVKVDRASMAVGLEARVPLIDPAVVRQAWRMDWQQKIGGGVGKLPLRRLLRRFVPEELFERPKAGFGVPIHTWLRGPLRGWAENLLSRDALEADGLLNANAIRSRWRQFLLGNAPAQHHIWTALMYQAWRRGPGATARVSI